MKKYLIGSSLLGLSNNKDEDYVIIDNSIDNKYGSIHEYKDGVDYFYKTAQRLDDIFNFRVDYKKDLYPFVVAYQYDKDIIKQDFPLEYHILDNREKWKEFLIYIAVGEKMNFTKKVKFTNGCISKLIYHIAYLTYILKNNSTTLTTEQKQKIQKIHDKQMPLEFLDELKADIMNLA